MGYLRLSREDGVAIVRLDQPESPVNRLSASALDEFDTTLDEIESDPSITSAVLLSAKKDSFVVGADIDEFSSVETPGEIKRIIQEGHRLFGRLESLSKPVVAAVHGAAVGGGLELILACHYRIASEHPATSFSMPEVQLGLLPGLGGTQRLPRVIGVQKALEHILTGKNVYPSRARRMGMIDATIHREGLLEGAKRAARGLGDGSLETKRRKRSMKDRALEETPLQRVVYQKALENANKQSRGNYPAIPRIVECVKVGRREGVRAGLEEEKEAFSELLFSPESAALRHLFHIKSAAEKNPYEGKQIPVKTLGILGAGLMGAGIAQVSAEKAGRRVLLKDSELELAAAGKKVIWEDLGRRVGKSISAFERDEICERVVALGDYDGLSGADLVIEAVPEDLALKRRMICELEAVGGEGMVIATNTSAIPLEEISACSKRPGNIVGMHYFSPVPRMPLLEIVKTSSTPEWVLATAFEEGLAQGKTVICVDDGPGFYTTRILAFYINEALLLLEEGARVEDIDEAMVDFGFPVGPLKLLDEVGIDTGVKINEVLHPLFEKRSVPVSDRGREVVGAGYRGRKSGSGFYLYDSGESKAVNQRVYGFLGGERRRIPAGEIQERLSLIMINEALRCLDEGILSSARDGDVGAVFGLGFPPFLGGPFWHTDLVGACNLLSRLDSLHQTQGERFSPPDTLKHHSSQGRTFY